MPCAPFMLVRMLKHGSPGRRRGLPFTIGAMRPSSCGSAGAGFFLFFLSQCRSTNQPCHILKAKQRWQGLGQRSPAWQMVTTTCGSSSTLSPAARSTASTRKWAPTPRPTSPWWHACSRRGGRLRPGARERGERLAPADARAPTRPHSDMASARRWVAANIAFWSDDVPGQYKQLIRTAGLLTNMVIPVCVRACARLPAFARTDRRARTHAGRTRRKQKCCPTRPDTCAHARARRSAVGEGTHHVRPTLVLILSSNPHRSTLWKSKTGYSTARPSVQRASVTVKACRIYAPTICRRCRVAFVTIKKTRCWLHS